MKKNLIAITLLTAVGGFGLLSSPALAFEQSGGAPRPPERTEAPDGAGPFMGRIAEVLELTPRQQDQIQTILKAEKEQAAPLRKKMMENRKQLQAVIETQPFDEEAVRTLAAAQADTRTELIVSRARVQNQISAVLTPQQRELARKIRPLMKDRPGPGRSHHGPGSGFDDNDL